MLSPSARAELLSLATPPGATRAVAPSPAGTLDGGNGSHAEASSSDSECDSVRPFPLFFSRAPSLLLPGWVRDSTKNNIAARRKGLLTASAAQDCAEYWADSTDSEEREKPAKDQAEAPFGVDSEISECPLDMSPQSPRARGGASQPLDSRFTMPPSPTSVSEASISSAAASPLANPPRRRNLARSCTNKSQGSAGEDGAVSGRGQGLVGILGQLTLRLSLGVSQLRARAVSLAASIQGPASSAFPIQVSHITSKKKVPICVPFFFSG